jgi:hypothetical protein
MDTRFWGPSGWKLLHLVAAEPVGNRADAISEWIHLLEYVLPCKYCRASFHDYIRLQPLTDAIVGSPVAFSRWMYDIHNRVNGKLRGQGLVTARDPSWPTVKRMYAKLHAGLCKGTPLLGWDFMTSVAFSTPAADYVPVPMPDAPESAVDWSTLDEATQNRYNLLGRDARIRYLKRWWALIPSILPCEAWRATWASAVSSRGAPPLERGREAVMRWMWRIEEAVCAGLRCPTPHRSRVAMEREVAAFESGCTKAKKGKTCRTLRKAQRRQVHVRRTRKGVGVL